MKDFLAKIRNKGTVMSMVSLAIIILTRLGFVFDQENVRIIAEAICWFLVLAGVFNNPDTDGSDLLNFIAKFLKK